MTDRRMAVQKVMLVGVLLVPIILGIRCWHKGHKARSEARQEAAFEQGFLARQVACDKCDAVSDVNVPYTDRRRFQVCPACKHKRARAIVYYTCTNPDCGEQLIKIRNHVFDGGMFHASPDGRPGIVCPKCDRPDDVGPEELFLEDAEKIAKKAGEQFP